MHLMQDGMLAEDHNHIFSEQKIRVFLKTDGKVEQCEQRHPRQAYHKPA